MLLAFDPANPRLPLGDWIAEATEWLTSTFEAVFDGIKAGLAQVYDLLSGALAAPPFWLVIIVFTALAWWLRSWRFALFTALGFYLIRALDQWLTAMDTLALVIMAATVSVVLAVPLGIWAARSETVSHVVRPVLDFMQTMPAMVYLIPSLAAFGIGAVPGMVATVVFAMPPGVRLTELAIRQVDPEVVEAGRAFGSPPGRILRQIQLPLALPTIMAGVNQVIMLALSMVVLASMVGAGGLGSEVLSALGRVDVARGVEAGLAVVILAIYLDRLLSSLGDRAPVTRAARLRD
ncbi:proline/glycine betaine ABC transporter permease [Kineosporiaceae bacterium SCSIO 59966]|nr:proline/glycine betaine ABC transporter permease [Kineosporiaceae bacterium SCSIO 59966]